jgi:hypothetical protein
MAISNNIKLSNDFKQPPKGGLKTKLPGAKPPAFVCFCLVPQIKTKRGEKKRR